MNTKSSAPSASPDASRRSERARQAILNATRDLVVKVGYDRLSIEGIAAAAGVGKQTIYRWWPSKAAVIFDAILESHSQESRGVTLPDTGNLEADLRSLLRATVAELTAPDNDRLQRAITAEIQTDTIVAEELVQRLLRPQMDAVAARIQTGIDAGQVGSSTDPALATELLFGPIFHRWLLRTGDVDEAYADRILDTLLSGFHPR